MSRLRTTISCRFFAQALALFVAACALPVRAEKEQVLLPILPATARWSVAISAPSTMTPVMTERQVFAVLPPGVVAAFKVEDGAEIWRVELAADFSPVAVGDHLFVAGGEAVHALRATDGVVAWRQPAGTLSAPPLVQDGWVITASGGEMSARRATDGTLVWKQQLGEQRHRGSIEGNLLFVPLTDGRIVALDVATGATRWQRRLRAEPSEILAIPGRLYVGSDDKYFYCLDAEDGDLEWPPVRVGAEPIGRPVADMDRVYFVSMDNMLRALDRDGGAIRWNVRVSFRPTSGPLLVGPTVIVPGPAADLRTFDAKSGRDVASIAFGERLASAPTFRETEKGPLAAAITGSLTAQWKLLLLEPSMRIPVEPLKVLPGLPTKLVPAAVASAMPLHVRHAPPPPAAAPLP